MLWTRSVYYVDRRHAAWLFCWSFVLKCGCSKSCESTSTGARLWPWDVLPYPGSWETDDSSVLARWFLSIPPCSWHSKALQAIQWGTRCRGVCCPGSHPLPPLGRRSLASWLLGWLARSLQWTRSGHEPPGRPGSAKGVILLHLEGEFKAVSGWLFPRL